MPCGIRNTVTPVPIVSIEYQRTTYPSCDRIEQTFRILMDEDFSSALQLIHKNPEAIY